MYVFVVNLTPSAFDPLGLRFFGREYIFYAAAPPSYEGKVSGRTVESFSLSSHCNKCAPTCHQIILDNCTVSARSYIYVNFNSARGGYKGLPNENVEHTRAHERTLRNKFKALHDSVCSEADSKLNTSCFGSCAFKTNPKCRDGRIDREREIREMWKKGRKEILDWDVKNRGNGPPIKNAPPPWTPEKPPPSLQPQPSR